MKKINLLLLIFCTGLLAGSAWAQNQWDIQLRLSSLDCSTNEACYTLELRSASGSDWALGDQNYRFFFDGDLMTVTSVSSLLPGSKYGAATIDQNLKISGQGQESASPLDDIDDNLGFLDFSIVQTDKSNPSTAQQLSPSGFVAVAEICVDVDPSVIGDTDGNNCLAVYHSRPATAGGITTQYTTLTENDANNSTITSSGAGYNDLTSADGVDACLGAACAAQQWDIRLKLSDLDCEANTACYAVELRSASGMDWALGDQNYRFFFDGDLMTVTSVNSVLAGGSYGAATIDQNVKISGQGQETSSPLDDIDDNLGFLDFSIVQTDKTDPSGAAMITSSGFTTVAEICVDVDPSVIDDMNGSTCLAIYHSRPATAGAVTTQYTTISENDAAGSTAFSMGATYDDLTSEDGSEACLGTACLNRWDIQLTLDNVDCTNNTACYTVELRSASVNDWALGDQNYRFFFDGDIMTVTSVNSLLPGGIYGGAAIDQNVKITGQGQEASSPLDDIDDHLGFLDFSIVQSDKSNPAGATMITTGGFTAVAEICVEFAPEVLDDAVTDDCITFYHSRPATAGSLTSQYTVISENDAANSTATTIPNSFIDVVDDCLEGACPDCIPLEIWVYLEGSLIDPQTGNYVAPPMRTTLNDSRLLPGQFIENPFTGDVYTPPLGSSGQVYNIPPWNYSGPEGAFYDSEQMPANADAGYPATVVDWVLISLRSDPDDGSEVLCQRAALLHNDGSVEFVDGDDCCSLDPGQSYYVVVEHRNHLIVMSDSPVGVVDGKLSYDFRDKQSYLNDPFNSGSFVRQKEVLPGVFAMIAGNGDQSLSASEDTDITASDYSKWLGAGPLTQIYSIVDYNMDGEVSALDFDLWQQNSPSFTSVPRD